MVLRGLIAAVILLGAFIFWQWTPTSQTPRVPTQTETPAGITPTFDTVRIDKSGAAVLAGRAAPFAFVSLLFNEKLIGSTYASARGEWVLVPNKPLQPTEPAYLRLRTKLKDGGILLSDEIITMSALRGNRKPYIVRTKPSGGADVLQSGAKSRSLMLEVIDYDDQGAAIFSGRAPTGSKVQLYFQNKFIGQADSNQNDKWRVLAEGLPEGTGALRLDLQDRQGKVLARLELPFKMEKNLKQKKGQVIIQPGDSLWKIARNLYGTGVLYTIILEQNKDNIKNPDLIYPGQIFNTPQP